MKKTTAIRKRFNKKGMMMSHLIEILITIIAFSLLGYVIAGSTKQLEYQESMALTRFTLAFAMQHNVGGAGQRILAPPVLIKTFRVEFPDDFDGMYQPTKEGFKKAVADLSALTWWAYLEGTTTNDVLESYVLPGHTKDKCIIQFVIKVNEIDQAFTGQDLKEYMKETPYKAIADAKRYCTEGEMENSATTNECITSDMDECTINGGTCYPNGCRGSLVSYNEWQCGSGYCCVEKSSIYSYMDYIQNGNGLVHIPPFTGNQGLLTIREGGVYAITFKDDTSLLSLLGKGDLQGIVISELDQVETVCRVMDD